MSSRSTVTDRRLLAALDYIDQKYIDDVFSIIKEPDGDAYTPVKSRGAMFKHAKIYIVLAATLVLLSFSSTLADVIIQAISDFRAGAGGSTEAPEVTAGMYDEYILTEEDLAELNEAYFKTFIANDPEFFEGLNEETLAEMRESKYCKFAQTVEGAMSRPTEKKGGSRYYVGKYGDCIVYFHLASEFGLIWPDFLLYVCYESQFYSLETAQTNGWVSETDVQMIQDYCNTIDYFDPE